MFDIRGKKALITAASSGIGLAVASVLAKSGVSVAISSDREEKIRDAAQRMQKDGLEIFPFKYDLISDSADDAVKKAAGAIGEIQILVVNYGDPRLAQFLELTESDWDRNISMFIRATTALVRSAVSLMSGWGRIIFITSMTTRQAYEGFAISGSLRAAIVNLGKTLSLELGNRGITVNSISQGYFLTERLEAVLEKSAARSGNDRESELKKIISEIPVGRIGKPEEIGYLVRFLCSDEASYITGANIPIDGGITRYPY